jgi:hypothetical protein
MSLPRLWRRSSTLVVRKLKPQGYNDNDVQSDDRNLNGNSGVRSSACLLLLLTGKKESAVYEGPFTRMATARSERLPVIGVGVMEVDERYNKADLAE